MSLISPDLPAALAAFLRTARTVSALHIPASDSRPVILAVEPNPMMAELIIACLDGAGYSVILAESCREAIEIAQASTTPQIDVLVTELNLPQMSGDYLAFWLRRTHPKLQTLLISDLAPRRTFIPVLHLTKPFTPCELLSSVSRTYLASTP